MATPPLGMATPPLGMATPPDRGTSRVQQPLRGSSLLAALYPVPCTSGAPPCLLLAQACPLFISGDRYIQPQTPTLTLNRTQTLLAQACHVFVNGLRYMWLATNESDIQPLETVLRRLSASPRQQAASEGMGATQSCGASTPKAPPSPAAQALRSTPKAKSGALPPSQNVPHGRRSLVPAWVTSLPNPEATTPTAEPCDHDADSSMSKRRPSLSFSGGVRLIRSSTQARLQRDSMEEEWLTESVSVFLGVSK